MMEDENISDSNILCQEEMDSATLITTSPSSSRDDLTHEHSGKNIMKNLSILCEQLTNMPDVLNRMVENGIFSFHEKEVIQKCSTSLEKNTAFFTLVLKKDWPSIENIVTEIFRDTSNEHVAAIITGSSRSLQEYKKRSKKRKLKALLSFSFVLLMFALAGGLLYWKLTPKKGILNEKWWPRKMNLVHAFYQRKLNGSDTLLVEGLQHTLKTAGNETEFTWKKVVIVGFPAIGKTEMAIWYSNYYADDYDFIIWISCEKESLHMSLINLARQLRIPGREELDHESLAQRIFDIFRGNKCLWVFDYAEYNDNQEDDMIGIKNILWEMRYPNFDCLITSQNTDWGREADYGKVQNFTLMAFTANESVDFLKTNLQSRKSEPMYEENLQKLAEILDDFPLALQIAINTLNDVEDVSLKDFIENTNRILNSTAHLPEYGKTIFTTMKMSIDSIKHMQYRSLAYDIMTVFGYLRPENVDMLLFGSVLHCDIEVLKEVLNLLEKRFLIRVSETDVIDFPGKINLGTLNVQRLLQLFMRTFVNGTKSEKEVLIKILEANGFIQYKLTPYAEYAIKYKDLQVRFKNLKAQLVEQLQVIHFLTIKQLEEAVLLSKIIHTGYTSGNGFLTSARNYGLCLHKAGRLEEALEIFLMLNQTLSWNPTADNWFVIQLNLTLELDQFQSSVWGIGLLRKVGMIKESLELQRELLYYEPKVPYIFVIDNYIDPIDLYTFKYSPAIYIVRTQIYIEGYAETNSYPKDAVVKDFVRFYAVSFLDGNGTFLKTINLNQLRYINTRDLSIYCSKEISGEFGTYDINGFVPSKINVDISELGNTTTSLTLSTADFVCTKENPHLRNLHLQDVKNFNSSLKYLHKLTNLHMLTISSSYWIFPSNFLDFYHIDVIQLLHVSFILSNEPSTVINHVSENYSISILRMMNCAFVSKDNATISKIHFADLNITNVKQLIIGNFDYDTLILYTDLFPLNFTPTDIKVDLSMLRHVQLLSLYSTEISCTQNEPVYNLEHLTLVNVTNFNALNDCLPKFISLTQMTIENCKSSLDFSKIHESLELLALGNISCKSYSTSRLSIYYLSEYGLENDLERAKFFKAANGIQSNCVMIDFDSSLCHPEKWIKNKIEMINFIKRQNTSIAFGAEGCATSDLKDVLNLAEYKIVNSSDYYAIKNGIGKSISKIDFQEFCFVNLRSKHIKFPHAFQSAVQ